MTHQVSVTVTYEEYTSEWMTEILSRLSENMWDLKFEGSNIVIIVWFEDVNDALIFKLSM